MATSVIPDLIDALFTNATAAVTTAQVLDGPGVTADPGNFLAIGADSMDLSVAARRATSETQAAATMGTNRSRDEVGDIYCVIFAWTGDGGSAGQKVARDAAFDVLAQVEDMLRTTPDQGLTHVSYLVVELGSIDAFLQEQDENGSYAQLQISIHFRSRI